MSKSYSYAILLSALAFSSASYAAEIAETEGQIMNCSTLESQLNGPDSASCGDIAADPDGEMNVLIKGALMKKDSADYRDGSGVLKTGEAWYGEVSVTCEGAECGASAGQVTVINTKVEGLSDLQAVTAWVAEQVEAQKAKVKTHLNQMEACMVNGKGETIEEGSSVQMGCLVMQVARIKSEDRANDYYASKMMQKLRDLMGSPKTHEQELGKSMITRLEEALKARETAGLGKLAFIEADLQFLKGITQYREERSSLESKRDGFAIGSADYKAADAALRALDLKAGKTYYDQGMKIGIDPNSAEAQETAAVDEGLVNDDLNAAQTGGETTKTEEETPAPEVEEETPTAVETLGPKSTTRGGQKAEGGQAKPAKSLVTGDGVGLPNKAMPAPNESAKDGIVPNEGDGVPEDIFG